jgi:hypothetical protein
VSDKGEKVRYLKLFAILLSCPIILGTFGCVNSLNIPKPQLNNSGTTAPLEFSLVNIPVTINLKPIVKYIEQNVPVEMASDSAWTDTGMRKIGMPIGYKYHIWRDPFKVSINGNYLNIESHLKYWVAGALSVPNPFTPRLKQQSYSWHQVGSCGLNEVKREAVISLGTKFELQKDGHFKTTTKVNSIDYPNLCGITILNFDITSVLNNVLTSSLNNLVTSIDSRIAQITNFRDICSSGWNKLQEPFQIDSAIWLTVNPVVPCISPFVGNGLFISTSIGIIAKPNLVFGPRPVVQTTPLPEINLNTPKAGSHVMLEGNLPYDVAAKILSQKLVGNRYILSKYGINIQTLQLYGAEQTVVLKLEVSGDIDGSIYLTGTPCYEISNDSLYIQNLDYSIETKNILTYTADWLLHSGFRQLIDEQAHWELGGEIAKVRDKIDSFLNPSNSNLKPPPLMSGSVSTLRSVGVYSTQNALRVILVADAVVNLNLDSSF